jgi:hypothetical protein
MESPDSVERSLRRHPSVESIPDLRGLFGDLELMNRITRLASMRQALEEAISKEILDTESLQARAREAAAH